MRLCLIPFSPRSLSVVLLGLAMFSIPARATTPTTTTLSVTLNGALASTVPYGSAIRFNAQVAAAGGGAAVGQVLFCNSDAAHCTGPNLLGAAEISATGVATLVIRPSIGAHRYKAEYVGTTTYTLSTSLTIPVMVTGQVLSSTTIAASGSVGNYSLTGQVTGSAIGMPSGTVAFQDATAGNTQIASTTLGSPAIAAAFTLSASPFDESDPFALIGGRDLNGDGYDDAITLGRFDDLGIYLSDGQGNFSTKITADFFVQDSIFPSNLTAPAFADFNRDGLPDIAIVNSAAAGLFQDGTLVVALNNGDGTFTKLPGLHAQNGIPLTGDFNGDGFQDIVLINTADDPADTTRGYVLLLGHGDGTFTSSTTGSIGTVDSGQFPLAQTADFNGDNITDFIVNNVRNTTNVVYLGQPNGTFLTRQTTTKDNFPFIVDVNDDGRQDLLTSNATVMLGVGDGTFLPTISSPGLPSSFVVTGTADFNHDGILDIVSASPAAIAPGNGDGTFGPTMFVASTPTGIATFSVVLDANGDGLPDLALQQTAIDDNFHVYLNTSTATAAATATGVAVAGTGSHAVLAHYNGDVDYAPSSSATIPLIAGNPVANKTSTLVTLSSSSIPLGGAVNVIVTVSNTTSPATPSTGKVFINDLTASGTVLIGYLSLSGGQAVLAYQPFVVGQHHITATYAPASGSSFNASVDNFGKTLTVDPISPVITFTVPSHTFGDPTFFLAATSTSPEQIVYAVLSGPAEVFGQRLRLTGAGKVVVQASQIAAGKYGAAAKNVLFTVAQAHQTLTFQKPPTQVTVGANPIPLVATSTSGLAVTFSVVSGTAQLQTTGTGASQSTSINFTQAGTVVVGAQQLGDTDYLPSQRTTYQVIVSPQVSAVAVPVFVSGEYIGPVTATSSGSAYQRITMLDGSLYPMATFQGKGQNVPMTTGAGQTVYNIPVSEHSYNITTYFEYSTDGQRYLAAEVDPPVYTTTGEFSYSVQVTSRDPFTHQVMSVIHFDLRDWQT